eukprot:296672-Amphidinium_carterae.1
MSGNAFSAFGNHWTKTVIKAWKSKVTAQFDPLFGYWVLNSPTKPVAELFDLSLSALKISIVTWAVAVSMEVENVLFVGSWLIVPVKKSTDQ